MNLNLKAVLGIEGVHNQENERARRVGHYLSYAVVVALLVVVVQILLDFSNEPWKDFYISLGVWLVFISEFTVNLVLVDKKWRYVRNNWLNVFIIVVAFPWGGYNSDWAAIFRMLRLVLFLRVIMEVFWDVVSVLRRNSFGMVLIGALFMIAVSGAIFAALEDTDFTTGLWYALVTITTVGYGDVVPYTEHGRLFGAVLIIFGVVLFSLVTANISAFLIGSEQRKTEKEILESVQHVKFHLEEQAEMHEKRMNHILSEVFRKLDDIHREIDAKHEEQIATQVKEFEIKILNETKNFHQKLDEIERRLRRSR
ncbi:MAG: potassium channel family protein [Hydrogenovibrio sp.]|nr:potassium channel family protein [Hydrogenovibrio sp.]